MNTLAIFTSELQMSAAFEIITLLIVAALIGYATAWMYYKSVYTARIKVLESERHEFNNHIVNLNADISNLHKRIIDHDSEKERLIIQVNALKALHAEAVDETNDMALRNIRNEQLLYEKDEALILIAQRKHLLDYKSFGIN